MSGSHALSGRRRRSHAAAPAPSSHVHRRTPTGVKVGAALVAFACLLIGLYLAWHYPGGAVPATAGLLVATLLARYFWAVWPGWMLALIPLIGLAPYTGWLWLEELDLLVLASAAGGYLALSGPHRQRPPEVQPPWRRELRWSGLVVVMLLAWCVSVLLAAVLGVQDAGGWYAGWFDGYHEAGNTLRAAKTLTALMLLAPLWSRVGRRAPQALTPSLLLGLGLLLAGVALGALYERVAYTGLSNFSSDYRTTSVFWEMHVGGAALDGALALTLPFGLLIALRQQGPRAFGLSVLLLALGGYVLLTTFSRGLYVAAVIGLASTMLLWWLQKRRRRSGAGDPASSWLPGKVPTDADLAAQVWPGRLGLLLIVLLGVSAAWLMFPSSGYRGLVGLLGALIALLAQPPGARETGQRVTSFALGLLLAAPAIGLSALLAWSVGKVAYLVYALVWALSMTLARSAWLGRHPWRTPLGDAVRAACWLWILGMVGVVAWNWGGETALDASWLPLAALAVCWPLSQGGSLGSLLATLSWRARVGALGVLMLAAAIVAALGGGSYVGERAATWRGDLEGRGLHWQRSLAILDAREAWLFGMGAGRFAAQFQLNAPQAERIGDYRLLDDAEGPRLVLSAGTHVLGWGEFLRLSQRVPDAPPDLILKLQARARAPLLLHVELCQKHLLYDAGCLSAKGKIEQVDGQWHPIEIRLGGSGELGHAGALGRALVLSLAAASEGKRVELRQLSLSGRDGVEQLRNGDFKQELAHWFPSSDRHHMPWHMKSLPLHVLFEQGLVGLVLGASLFLLAVGRLIGGHAREHPLAPALVGGLAGFVVVGLFDSLVDAPRIAFLFYLLVLIALGLRAPPPMAASKPTNRPV